MNTCNFYIDNYVNKRGFSQIIAKYGAKRQRLSITVPSHCWNRQKQECGKTYEHWYEVNEKLRDLKSFVEKQFLLNPGRKFSELIDEYFSGPKDEVDEDTLGYILNKIKDIKVNSVSKSRTLAINVIIKDLKNFKLLNIPINELNKMHLQKFINWLIGKGNSNNTVIKKINILHSQLKAYSGLVEKLDMTIFEDLQKPRSYESTMIALTPGELKKIAEVELSEQLSFTRDAFVFACNTGARYSDVKSININANIKNNIWTLRVKKTTESLRIPLNNNAREIIEKYKEIGKLIVPSSQKVNENIKEICRKAGLEEAVVVTHYNGSKRIDEEIPKWKAVSFHTARRTFITIALTKGIQANMVMDISGHTDLKSFRKYVKFSNQQISEEFLKKWE